MTGIKLEIPDHFIFKTEIPVRITDLNYGNHLANDAVLSIVHEARVRFLNNLGYAEDNIEGVGIIMGDAAIVFKSEGFYGDVLVIDLAVTNFGRKSCDFFYQVKNKSDGREVALVKTGIIFYDYQLRKPVAIPEKFKLVCQNKKGIE